MRSRETFHLSRWWLKAFALGIGWTLATHALADEVTCGSLYNGQTGPWDYNDPANRVSSGATPQGNVKLVENVHFKPETENLTAKNVQDLVGDLTYTLRAFPNHPRALTSLSRLERRLGGHLPGSDKNRKLTADCFFDRALRFRPDDTGVYVALGVHLHTRKQYADALVAYKRAETLGTTSTQLDYNIGLVYFDLKDYQNAREYAKKAYDAGYPLPGLREKLVAAKQWP